MTEITDQITDQITADTSNDFDLDDDKLKLWHEKYASMIEKAHKAISDNAAHVNDPWWDCTFRRFKGWQKLDDLFGYTAANHIYCEGLQRHKADNAKSQPPAAPESTESYEDDIAVPIIDRTEIDAYNMAGKCETKFITEADVELMDKRLRKVLTADDFTEMNHRVKKRNQRQLTWYEFAFVACVHRMSIMTNKQTTEDGRHQGDSPTNRAASIYAKGQHGLKLDRITEHHAAEVFSTLEKFKFARCIRPYNKVLKQCGRYEAEPSQFWAFPTPREYRKIDFPHKDIEDHQDR